VETIRPRYPTLVKVLLSGYTELADIQRAVTSCGIHNYVVKPVDSQQLMAAIDEAYKNRDELITANQ
jgi:YesN/AraC family two-component response regulator